MAGYQQSSKNPPAYFPKEYFTIKELNHFSGLGERFLRDSLKDPQHPLPHFRIGHKTILISRSDFAQWIERFHVDRGSEIDRLVNLALVGVTR